MKGALLFFVVALGVLLWTSPGPERFLVNGDQGYQLALGRQVLVGAFPYPRRKR